VSADTKAPAPAPQTSWTWPHPPRSNRYGATVTEVVDTASDDRRVAVIEGAVWPPVGTFIRVFEDDAHMRTGSVLTVELVLENRQPARVVVRAEFSRQPA
jgi:hypothetical protein